MGVPDPGLLQRRRHKEVHAGGFDRRPEFRTVRLTRVDDARARQRWHVDRIVDEFVADGYKVDAKSADGSFVLVGEDDIDRVPVQLEVRVPSNYPFVGPKVRAVDGSGGNSWHQDPDGWLCLWDVEKTDPGAWGSRTVIVDRVRGWFHEAANGWPDDAPDLDLDRYWPRAPGLVLYDELPSRGWVRLKHVPATSRDSVWETRGNGGSRKRNQAAGFVVDIGEPERPPRTLFDLVDLAGEVGAELQDAIDKRQLGWIMVRYERRGHEGVLVLRVVHSPEPTLTAVASAGTSATVRALRAGPEAVLVGGLRVLIVGLGGVGSFVADELARAGVKSMTLIDGDTLLPGNLVRHVLRDDSVGWNKATAMKRHLVKVRGIDPMALVAVEGAVVGLDDACALLEKHDLAVDATGDLSVAAALADAAEMLDKPVVSAATAQDGRVIRVDRFPLMPGESLAPDPPLPPSPHPPIFDCGCGGPVSSTPPWVVMLAASHAAGTVIALLTSQPVPPSYVQTVVADGPAEEQLV